ncbi:hypothetical protein BH10BAC3_BH10BAC3_19680 [soil metagenome]
MNRRQKLVLAIQEVEHLNFKKEEAYFINEVVPKLHVIHDLLNFPEIDHHYFKAYLSFFQNDVKVDIDRCSRISPSNAIESMEVLALIKKHIQAKLKVAEFAFSYYLNDTTLLLQEANDVKSIKLNTVPKRPLAITLRNN